MLYLIKSYTKEGPILKIGYASDIDKRLMNYRCHNPGHELLATREGDEGLEKRMHRYFILYLYENFNEWFAYEEEIVRIFKEEPDSFFDNPILPILITKSNKKRERERFTTLSSQFPHLKEFWEGFYISTRQSRSRMKMLCEFLKENPQEEEKVLENVPAVYKRNYTVLGPRRCWAFSYQMNKLEEEYQRQLSAQRVSPEIIRDLVHSNFKEGEKYLQTDLKRAAQGIYDQFGLKKTGKAKDFETWFELKPCKLNVNGKRENGFELIKKKK